MEKTIMELYREAKARLAALPVEVPETEALLLCEQYFGLRGRAALTVHGGEIAPEEAAAELERALGERAERPLQYILGEWEFCDMRLKVGEGVLVPREDTAALVELAAESLKDVENPRVLDLCAGSGAVALGMAQKLPGATFVCAELSEKAMPYLRANAEKYAPGRVEIISADVLKPPVLSVILAPESFDAIVSNPPYIPSGEIPELSREVHQEPHMALDGGTDGMDFYRAITEEWLVLLRSGGRLAFELGFEQLEYVKGIFVRLKLNEISIKKDFSDINRAIVGTLTR